MYTFKIVDELNLNMKEFEGFSNKKIFTTIPWLHYLESLNKCKATIIRITDQNGVFKGYLTGMIVKKFGIKIFGSPFKGWGTEYMGFDLVDYSDVDVLVSEAITFIIKELKCMYAEIVDYNLGFDLHLKCRYKTKFDSVGGLELKIDKDDETLMKSFKKDARNFIRQFEKRGAIIRQVDPDDNFINNYCHHLKDVFAKQGLVPTYGYERVRALTSNLEKSGNLMCLDVYEPENGKSIATSITFGYNGYCYTWGTSSDREFQSYRPNETIRFLTMKFYRDRDCHTMDMCGRREYKYKFNPYETEFVRITASRYRVLFVLRNIAQKMFSVLQRIKGMLKRR